MSIDQKLDTLIAQFDEFKGRYRQDKLEDAELLGNLHKEFVELNSAVRGNERNDQPGLIIRVRESVGSLRKLEDRVDEMEKKQYKVWAWFVSITAGVNVAYIAIKEFFAK